MSEIKEKLPIIRMKNSLAVTLAPCLIKKTTCLRQPFLYLFFFLFKFVMRNLDLDNTIESHIRLK